MNNLKDKFPIGSVAYYVKKHGYKWSVWFGVVADYYSDGISLELYDLVENRRINGVEYNKFTTPTHWAKLPKGWTYNTELFTLTFDERENSGLNINNPNDILQAINEELLVKVSTKDYSHIEAEVDTYRGYRLVRKSSQDYHPSYVSISWDKLYKTLAEAKNVIAVRKIELARQASLSDYDWSIEQIDKVLMRWQIVYGVSEELKQEYREWLLNRKHIEDVEVRLFAGEIQWRYWKNRYGKVTRWHNIIL